MLPVRVGQWAHVRIGRYGGSRWAWLICGGSIRGKDPVDPDEVAARTVVVLGHDVLERRSFITRSADRVVCRSPTRGSRM